MVAPSDTPSSLPQHDVPDETHHPTGRVADHFQNLFTNLRQAARLQIRILTLKAQATLKKIILSIILAVAATLAGMAGLVFLYIFIFRLLTDVAHLPVVWAWLIFAALHIVTAASLGLITALMWRKAPKTSNSKPGGNP